MKEREGFSPPHYPDSPGLTNPTQQEEKRMQPREPGRQEPAATNVDSTSPPKESEPPSSPAETTGEKEDTTKPEVSAESVAEIEGKIKHLEHIINLCKKHRTEGLEEVMSQTPQEQRRTLKNFHGTLITALGTFYKKHGLLDRNTISKHLRDIASAQGDPNQLRQLLHHLNALVELEKYLEQKIQGLQRQLQEAQNAATKASEKEPQKNADSSPETIGGQAGATLPGPETTSTSGNSAPRRIIQAL